MKELSKVTQTACNFMERAEAEVFSVFAGLSGARRIKCKGSTHNAVYVPGTRKDRVLLVAHADTVWGDNPLQLGVVGDTVRSMLPGVGIGADNRLGCAALYMLRNLGHSLLIVPDEEIGCVGSQAVLSTLKWRTELANHQFIMQFDRRGATDFVTYSCANDKFNKWMLDRMPKYAKTTGSFSDVAVLMPTLKLAGCNISIGFRAEHTSNETADLIDFYRTVETSRTLLKGPCKAFEFMAQPWGQGYHNWRSQQVKQSYSGDYLISAAQKRGTDSPYVWCPSCQSTLDPVTQVYQDICTNCGKDVERLYKGQTI